MMCSIIMRSALVAWGRNPPPDLHSIVDGKIVTWNEVMANRRKRQAETLRRKRWVDEWRAHKLWVAYFDQDLMGGWQAMIEDYRGRYYDIWIDRDCRWLKPKLMNLFPLILPIGSEHDQWSRWKPEFASQYQRGVQDGKPRGVVHVWWNRRDIPRLG